MSRRGQQEFFTYSFDNHNWQLLLFAGMLNVGQLYCVFGAFIFKDHFYVYRRVRYVFNTIS